MSKDQPQQWRLVHHDNTLGTLTFLEIDLPWIDCHFEPTENFAEYVEMFEQKLMTAENEKLFQSWNEQYGAVESEMKLVALADSDPIAEFSLYVDGDSAWFRAVFE